MQHHKAFLASPFSFLLFIFLVLPLGLCNEDVTADVGPVVTREQRRTLTVTEYGEISAIDIGYGHRAPYHLQFFTLEPNSLFLPVILHEDMVIYVQTGSGNLTCADENDVNNINIRRGDIVSLRAGSVFYLQSSWETESTKLRMVAIFGNTEDNTYDPAIGVYSSISELVRGFGKKIMQAVFQAPNKTIEAITNRTESPAIVRAISKNETTSRELEAWFLKEIAGTEGGLPTNSKKIKTYNIFQKNPDFQSCDGWSLTVTKKQLKSLKDTNIGFSMVNLTTGSMVGPHWNAMTTQVLVVLEGEGMVRGVCGSSNINKQECRNMRFKVTQGDAFMVPRFHPVAQMSYNNDSLVFIGFTTSAKRNYAQYLAGKRSVIQTLDKNILAASLNATNTTIDQLLASRADSIIVRCVSCAEEEERTMKEEIKKKEEDEARKREEEKRKEEEEEARKKEEEEAQKREEERKKEEEAREREEERKRQEARQAEGEKPAEEEWEGEQTRRPEEERERSWEEEGGRGAEWGEEERESRETEKGEVPRNENSFLQARRVLKTGRR
ncbi:hypothetical protein L6164_020013 [Bauhinia variegata]|uniref:Uncharacterized protein n=1 Tax=Bauhinia variegata TaxID=167791 RepID=A0ACB9MX48_BAUVA|nr:hypothetical protein L6164_020013 [Bauhinia variegata]